MRLSAENKTLVRRLYDEGINRHDAIAAAAFYAEDAVNHGRTVGREGTRPCATTPAWRSSSV